MIKNIKDKLKFVKEIYKTVKDKIKNLSKKINIDKGYEYLKRSYSKILYLFKYKRLKEFIFEYFKSIFNKKFSKDITEDKVLSTITLVTITNVVLIGLPGKLGVGILVSQALEIFMAYRIAKLVGLEVNTPKEAIQNIPFLLIVAGFTFILMKQILEVTFSIFNVVGLLPATAMAAFVGTNFLGILFWVVFSAIKEHGYFEKPESMWNILKTKTKKLTKFQIDAIGQNLTKENLKVMGLRAKEWLTGEMVMKSVHESRAKMFDVLALAALVEGNTEKLKGPLGEMFMQSIRERIPKLAEMSDAEIAEYMRVEYDADQLIGVHNLIKGKMFEHIMEERENLDSDNWTAKLHSDEFYPGSDIIYTNEETGEVLEIQLKAVENPQYIENALLKYPDIEIQTTSEVAKKFLDDPRVMDSGITHKEVETITEDNFDIILAKTKSFSSIKVVTGATVIATAGVLWPFVIAYMRNKITKEQLEKSCKHIFPKIGKRLAIRISFAAVFGPIYVWVLLAKSVYSLGEEVIKKKTKFVLFDKKTP